MNSSFPASPKRTVVPESVCPPPQGRSSAGSPLWNEMGPGWALLHYAARPCGLAMRQFFNRDKDNENEVKRVGDVPGRQTPTLTRT